MVHHVVFFKMLKSQFFLTANVLRRKRIQEKIRSNLLQNTTQVIA